MHVTRKRNKWWILLGIAFVAFHCLVTVEMEQTVPDCIAAILKRRGIEPHFEMSDGLRCKFGFWGLHLLGRGFCAGVKSPSSFKIPVPGVVIQIPLAPFLCVLIVSYLALFCVPWGRRYLYAKPNDGP